MAALARTEFVPAAATPKVSHVSGLRVLGESFRRTLRAEHNSERTVETYGEALRLFDAFLARQGMPRQIAGIKREHVEAFIAELLAKWKPATASNRYRALHSFFKWAVEEGEIKTSPMANTKPPVIPEQPPTVLNEEDLRRLLRQCEGKDFESRRDTAIIRLLLDTGMRRAELTGLMVEDIDFEHNIAVVLGKG
jgi:site-specific recombinase XerD